MFYEKHIKGGHMTREHKGLSTTRVRSRRQGKHTTRSIKKTESTLKRFEATKSEKVPEDTYPF